LVITQVWETYPLGVSIFWGVNQDGNSLLHSMVVMRAFVWTCLCAPVYARVGVYSGCRHSSL
jgi:hypothetical protein